MLHVGDIDGTTRRSKVQPLLDIITPTFRQYLVPRKAVTVDEAIIMYRGRVSFRRASHIPGESRLMYWQRVLQAICTPWQFIMDVRRSFFPVQISTTPLVQSLLLYSHSSTRGTIYTPIVFTPVLYSLKSWRKWKQP